MAGVPFIGAGNGLAGITSRTASGANDPGDALTKLGARVRADRSRLLRAAGLELVREIKLLLSTPGRGRIYRIARLTKSGDIKRSKRTGRALYRTHQASAPGDPPAVDLGQLRNSIHLWLDERAEHARVGTNVSYARPLEFGTLATGGYIAPRPFMRPALRRVQKRMGFVIAQGLKTAARR